MSISLNANFELLSAGLYLDARQQFNTIIEMKDFAETSIPDGFITYNKETQKHYVFNSSNTVDATLGKWREYNSGDSSSTTYATWNSNVDYKVGNVVLKDEVRYSCIADHTSTDFETDSINWVVVLEQYYHVTQEQYNKMVSDGLITDSTKDLYIIDGNSEGGNSYSASYTSLGELGLTADATIEDVVNALNNGESFLAPVNTFTNYETIFPNKVPSDQWNKIHIIKGTSLPNSHIRCFSQSGACEYLANVNNTNITGWNDVSGTYTDISDAIIEKLGNEILKYPVGKYRINSTTTGNKFTDLPSDAEMKCGLIEVNGTAVGKSPFTDTWVYRMYKFECLTGTSSYVRRLNSGATAGQIEVDTGWCKEGQETYTSLNALGLTADATIQDVRDVLPIGSTALLRTDAFTNWSTLFNGIQWGYLKVEKTVNGLSNIELQEVIKPTRRYFGTQAGGKFVEWQQVASGITDVLINNSSINQVPNAKLMAMEIYGRNFTIDDYSDALTMLAGKWRVDTNNKASQMQNLPVPRAGILEVKYLNGNNGTTAYTGTRNYAMLTYTDIDGNIYKRSFNSNDTVGNIVNDTGWQKLATETQLDELFQSVSSGKTLVANAITGKGVSTATDATFATMATNISKISGCKEETKSFNVTSSAITPITLTFSNDVSGVKKVMPPTYSCRITTQTSGDIFTINGKELTFCVTGVGTWEVTALI